VPRFAIDPLGLTTEGGTKFKPKGGKRYLKKLQCANLPLSLSLPFRGKTDPNERFYFRFGALPETLFGAKFTILFISDALNRFL